MTAQISNLPLPVAFVIFMVLIFSVILSAYGSEDSNKDMARILRHGCSPGDDKLIRKLVTRLVEAEKKLKRLEGTCKEHTLLSEDDVPEQSQIYFTTQGGGIIAFSPSTSLATTVRNSSENIIGIAYDSGTDFIYWSDSKIYRAPAHGGGATEPELVLDNVKQYGWIWGMEYDWIGDTVYAVTDKGFVIACNTGAEQVIRCATVLSGLGTIRGVALNPTSGVMYLTTHAGGTKPELNRAIVRAGMDGSDASAIVTGLKTPCGIVYEFKSGRIYWADDTTKKIQSSDATGADVRTIVTLSNGPLGLALYGKKIYFGYYWSDVVQSMSKAGGDIRTVYTAAFTNIRNFVVPDWNAPTNRTNHCLKHSCLNVCVLTATSFSCLD